MTSPPRTAESLINTSKRRAAPIARPLSHRWLSMLFVVTLSFAVHHANAADEEGSYDQGSTLDEAAAFFGEGAAGIGDVIEKIFEDLGEPNAYIKGTEASGALGIGARYGDGTLLMKNGSRTKVHWSGPSIGFDVGGNVSKVFVLVYKLPNTDAIFQRFPAVDGSFYVVGGVGANYHQRDNIVLAPIRLGAGFRAGVNIGYMHYRRKKSWNPF